MFRIIPSFETHPTALRFVQSPAGKIVLLFLAGLGLRLNDVPHGWYTAVLLILPAFWPAQRLRLVACINVGTWILLGGIFQTAYPGRVLERLLQSRQIQPSQAEWIGLEALAVLTLVGLSYLGLRIIERLRASASSALPILLLLFSILVLATEASRGRPQIFIFSFALLILASNSFWYFAYSWRDRHLISDPSRWNQIALFSPFWSRVSAWNGAWVSFLPMPRGFLDLEVNSAPDSERLAACQLRGLKLIYFSFLLRVVHAALQMLIFDRRNFGFSFSGIPSLAYPDFDRGLVAYNAMTLSFHQMWVAVLTKPLAYLIRTASSSGAMIGIVRLYGFDVFRNVYRPHRSKDFNDFLKRVFYYYIELLYGFFFFPFFRLFRFLNSIQLRKFMTVFCTIALGGSIVHFIREVQLIGELGTGGALRMALLRFPFLGSLGLCAAIASLLPKTNPFREPSVPELFARSAGFFFIYSLCFTLETRFRLDPIPIRIEFLLKLLGIQG